MASPTLFRTMTDNAALPPILDDSPVICEDEENRAGPANTLAARGFARQRDLCKKVLVYAKLGISEYIHETGLFLNERLQVGHRREKQGPTP